MYIIINKFSFLFYTSPFFRRGIEGVGVGGELNH